MPDSALNTFAAELKAWRERMGLTQQAFADKLGYSLALVAAVEQCKRSPTPEFAARCDEVTGAPGTFTRWQVQVSRESYPAFFAPVLAFERDAVLQELAAHGHRVAETARALGLERSHLYKKCQQLGIDLKAERQP